MSDEAENPKQHCEACKADVTDELFCPACGAAVIPQKTKLQNKLAQDQERTRHQPLTRTGLVVGFVAGACIGMYLFSTYRAPKGAESNREGWACFLAFFPFYGAALGGAIAAALALIRSRP